MKAMLYSDYLNIKQSVKAMIYLPIFFLVIAFVTQSPAFLGTALVMLSLVLPINLFSADASHGWDNFTLSFPISRTQVILSKYCLCFVVLTGILAFMLVGSIAYCAIYPNESLPEMAAMLLLCAALALILIAVALPLIVKYGTVRGRYVLMAVILIPTMLFLLLPTMLPQLSLEDMDAYLTDSTLLPAALILLAVSLVFHIVSALITVAIYRKKEF